MIVFKHSQTFSEYIQSKKSEGRTIGFVPTMGALHQGHVHLINACKRSVDITICSIFINPTQFNDITDYEKYPIKLEEDIHSLLGAECDILFMPPINDIYPTGTSNLEKYQLGYLETILEGKFRPGHFQGVCQVMSRLLTIVHPHVLFMGQKDYQQCLVIKRLIEISGMKTELIIYPTMREPEGLAMSSRNLRLNEQQKNKAQAIYEALEFIRLNLVPGDLTGLKTKARSILLQNEFKIDYVEIAEADSLNILSSWDGQQNVIALFAGFIGDVRLIDNLFLTDHS